jgi:hypothetical protein
MRGRALAVLVILLGAAGAFAEEGILTFFAPAEITSDIDRDVTVFFSSLNVDARVGGTVYVVGGVCTLGPHAVVRDLIVLFGNVRTEDGSRIIGKKVLIAPLAAESNALPTRISLALFWLFWAFILSAFFPSQLAVGSFLLNKNPGLSLGVGLASLVIFALLFTLFFFMLQVVVGYPLLLSLLVFFFLAKAYGMVVLFWMLGSWAARRWGPVASLFAGWLILNLVRLIPYAGPAVWWLATMLALGIVLVQLSFRFKSQQSLFVSPAATS